jgi:hypothetical protein
MDDHVALWPMNSKDEVQRLLKLFGSSGQRLTAVVDVKPQSDDDDEKDISITLSASMPGVAPSRSRYQWTGHSRSYNLRKSLTPIIVSLNGLGIDKPVFC